MKDAKYLIPTLAVGAVGLQQKKQIANMLGLKLTLNIGRNKKSVLTPLSVSLLYGRVSTGIGANGNALCRWDLWLVSPIAHSLIKIK